MVRIQVSLATIDPFIEVKIMILGMSTASFTLLHVIISLIGIASGAVVMWGLWNAKSLGCWTALYLLTTALTSATGFLFH